MKHRSEDDPQRHRDAGRRHGGHRGGHGKRLFGYGELRLLLLAMIAERPRHGYELMKAIEDQLGGRYVPSPGVIYPTLSWLEDMGYAALDLGEPGRKRYGITQEGEAFLFANRAAADAVVRRASAAATENETIPAAIHRAKHRLKAALHARLERGGINPATAEAIAAALDAAAEVVERS